MPRRPSTPAADSTLDLLPCPPNRRIAIDGGGLLLAVVVAASSWYGLATLALVP